MGDLEALVFAGRLDDYGAPVRRFPSGRLCREFGCATRLSIYNEDLYCSRHQPMVTLTTRNRVA